MKRRILGAAALISIVLIHGSCYKTGELIPQVTCKPTFISFRYPYENNFYYTVNFATGNPSGEYTEFNITYDNNRRLISALATGHPQFSNDGGSFYDIFKFNFSYDGKGNMVRIDEYDTSIANLNYPVVYIIYTYPPNTTGSISSTLQTQRFYLNNILQTVQGSAPVYIPQHVLTNNFNTEFQLVSVYDGGTLLELRTYDFGGNMQTDTVYAGLQKPLAIGITGYDSQINPGRSDRTIQLFLCLYSKNNLLGWNAYTFDPANGGNGWAPLYNTGGNSFYTYIPQGYPSDFGPKAYADYACLVAPGPPVINPGPGAAGN
jgi:hypothetical protein